MMPQIPAFANVRQTACRMSKAKGIKSSSQLFRMQTSSCSCSARIKHPVVIKFTHAITHTYIYFLYISLTEFVMLPDSLHTEAGSRKIGRYYAGPTHQPEHVHCQQAWAFHICQQSSSRDAASCAVSIRVPVYVTGQGRKDAWDQARTKQAEMEMKANSSGLELRFFEGS